MGVSASSLLTNCDYGQVTACPWASASSPVKGGRVINSRVETSYMGHLFFPGIMFGSEREKMLGVMKTVVREGWGGLGTSFTKAWRWACAREA